VLFGNNGNSYTVCTVSDMWVYIHVFFTVKRRWSGITDNKNIGRDACQENLSACHFGHACHRFVSPWTPLFWKRFQTPHTTDSCFCQLPERYSLQWSCTYGTRDLRQPHAALEQRFGSPNGSDGRFREHGSELFWFRLKNREFLD